MKRRRIRERRPASKMDAAEHVEVRSRAAWRAWLARHHERSTGAWAVTWKKASGGPHVPYGDLVEEALCFGWVDSRPGRVDAERSKLWFAPRKPTSKWSAANKARVERLLRAGRMAPRGRELVEIAQRTGTWTALESVDRLEVPADLARELAARPGARAHFDAFPPSARRGILDWVLSAKLPATRARRVAETARLAARNERANAWRPR